MTVLDPLFRPLTIRNLTLKNRIMSTSHASGMDDAGMPAERYQRYHEEKAKGGLALTMFGGSSNVAPDSPSVFQQLRVDDDRVIPHFRRFAERIHAHGAALMCQITHLGRRGDPLVENWLPTIAPSRVRETLHRSIPREMDEHDIARVVKAFGEAARRCREGGLDGLETMGAGHLIGQFLSPDTNLRTDRFGGSIQNRVRFALMVHEEIRRQAGDGLVIGIRLSIDEGRGGASFEDMVAIAQILECEALVDFINCNVGRIDTEIALAEENMPGMTRPLAPFLDRVRAFRQEVRLPIFHAARITDVATARHAIRNGVLDMVSMTRGHIADPQIVNKIRRGEEDRIRPCIGASHCMYKKPHCLHNVASGRETVLPQVVERAGVPGRKVVVVGGGPAGLEAARVAAERGHRVVVFEAAPRFGGQILIAARASWRRDLAAIIDWRVAELGHMGVEMRLNHYAEPEHVLSEAPDVVIVATGGIPAAQSFPGAELCQTTWEILSGEVAPQGPVLICDGTGRHEAVSTADHLGSLGVPVILATIDDRVAAEMGYAERSVYRKRLTGSGVTMFTDIRLSAVRRTGNGLTAEMKHELTGQLLTLEAGQIIVEAGTEPVDELFDELRGVSRNHGVTDIDALLAGEPDPGAAIDGFVLHRAGDAVSSRSIHAAILDAFRISVRI